MGKCGDARSAGRHTRYDLLPVVRSIELFLGMTPLSLNDANATPMHDAYGSTPANAGPVRAITVEDVAAER